MEEFVSRKNSISNSLICLMVDIEKAYDLRKGEFYQVKTHDGKVFKLFFIETHPYASTWGSSIDIWVSFFKSKENGTKSKIKKGFFIKEISEIEWIPF